MWPASAVVVLIPAFQPSAALVELVHDLHELRPVLDVLVVDDGSGRAYDGIFGAVAASGAQVLRLPVNRGKGAALKVGFAHVRRHAPGAPVVCADADGQHAADDVVASSTTSRPRRPTGALWCWGCAISTPASPPAAGSATS